MVLVAKMLLRGRIEKADVTVQAMARVALLDCSGASLRDIA